MVNPCVELHKAFRAAGAEVLLSSGQACVLYGIAAFSKDGDWVIRETPESCAAVLAELGRRGASYRLGAPLDIRWLAQGWTSHFELRMPDGYRARADFVSRPPRVPDLEVLWQRRFVLAGLEVVDIASLLQLKQTARQRDYSVIGALAEACGFNEGHADIALDYLQDYDLLAEAVRRWPAEARRHQRGAVRLLVSGAPRTDVVAALAVEQDVRITADRQRLDTFRGRSREFAHRFAALRTGWSTSHTPLAGQHAQLMDLAHESLGKGAAGA